MKKILFSLLLLLIATTNANSQCTNLTDIGGPYTDFNTAGIPCGTGPGAATTTLTFQSWENEAYLLNNLQAGANYVYNFCTGYSAAVWTGNITVAAWDGTAATSVVNDCTACCSLNFTVPSTGNYIVIINAAGGCGQPSGTADNGTPTLSIGPLGAACPVVVPCSALDTGTPTPTSSPSGLTIDCGEFVLIGTQGVVIPNPGPGDNGIYWILTTNSVTTIPASGVISGVLGGITGTDGVDIQFTNLGTDPAGTTYCITSIITGNYNAATETAGTGSGTFSAACSEIGPSVCFTMGSTAPPTNDVCTGAIPLTVGATIASDNYCATATTPFETTPATTCTTGATTSGGVWFNFTVPAGNYTLQASSVSDVILTVFTGACGALSVYDCLDSPAGGGETLVLGSLPAGTYSALVSDYADENVSFEMSLINNDICASSFIFPPSMTSPALLCSGTDLVFDVSGLILGGTEEVIVGFIQNAAGFSTYAAEAPLQGWTDFADAWQATTTPFGNSFSSTYDPVAGTLTVAGLVNSSCTPIDLQLIVTTVTSPVGSFTANAACDEFFFDVSVLPAQPIIINTSATACGTATVQIGYDLDGAAGGGPDGDLNDLGDNICQTYTNTADGLPCAPSGNEVVNVIDGTTTAIAVTSTELAGILSIPAGAGCTFTTLNITATSTCPFVACSSCTANAGVIINTPPTPCLPAGGSAIIAATNTGTSVPAGANIAYVLTDNSPALTILQAPSATPSFSVNTIGSYIIHAVVFTASDLAACGGAPSIGSSAVSLINCLTTNGACFDLSSATVQVVNTCVVCPTNPSISTLWLTFDCGLASVMPLELGVETGLVSEVAFTFTNPSATGVTFTSGSANIPANTSCSPINHVISFTATCIANGAVLADATSTDNTISIQSFPQPANFAVTVTPSAGCGAAPIVSGGSCVVWTTSPGWAGGIAPVAGCSSDLISTNNPVAATYSWQQAVLPAFTSAAPCVYAPPASGSPSINGCDGVGCVACLADAGSIAAPATACGNTVTVSIGAPASIPAGSELVYVLTNSGIISHISATPTFTSVLPGNYVAHALVTTLTSLTTAPCGPVAVGANAGTFLACLTANSVCFDIFSSSTSTSVAAPPVVTPGSICLNALMTYDLTLSTTGTGTYSLLSAGTTGGSLVGSIFTALTPGSATVSFTPTGAICASPITVGVILDCTACSPDNGAWD